MKQGQTCVAAALATIWPRFIKPLQMHVNMRTSSDGRRRNISHFLGVKFCVHSLQTENAHRHRAACIVSGRGFYHTAIHGDLSRLHCLYIKTSTFPVSVHILRGIFTLHLLHVAVFPFFDKSTAGKFQHCLIWRFKS